ncbi:F-box/WD repeat-containing protein 7-like [Orbicella faveolata]|uniref:F-box/WD repeat-containing protein 7-like n=1 Tax=Orbicella faveolata TaxID=48498 RepID=UPI0009E332AB|nr:F-box/WD repeat-containing protein 7-like [Orbicella faveolata]
MLNGFAKHRPLSTIEYEQQLDYLCQWIEKWSNQVRRNVIDLLLPRCDQEQITFLWTVVEPTLHRDFMYSSLNAFPRSSFSPVSIPLCREVHKKLGKPRYRAWKLHRVESAILHDEEEVKAWTSATVLPIVKSPSRASPSKQTKRTPSPERVDSRGSWKSQTTYFGVKLPGISSVGAQKRTLSRFAGSRSAPPGGATKTSSQHAVRRHMQNEYKKDVLNSDALNGAKPEDVTSWQRLYKSKSCPNVSYTNSVYSQRRQVHHRTKTEQYHSSSWCSDSLPENAQCLVQWFEQQWSGWQKNEFLQLFLRVLAPSELYFLSGLLAVKQYRDFIAMLPEQLAIRIFSFLVPKELLVVCQVSKTWRLLASKDELWKAKCQETYVGVPLSTPAVWKEIFRDNVNLKHNWAKGRFKVTDMVGHTHNVLSVCAYKNYIATGSLDRTIKIWGANSGALLQTFQGHTRGVWSLRFLSSSIVISGSYDKTIRLWSLRTSMCVRILISHEGPVWAIERKGDFLVSGSSDKTAKVWNIRQCKLLFSLVGHNGCVFCVDLDDECKKAFTGSGDRTVRVWEVSSGVCLSSFNIGQLSPSTVTAVSSDQGHLAVGSGQLVSLWNLETGAFVNEFKGHKGRIESIKLKFMMVNGKKEAGLIVSAGKDGLIKYWDIEQGSCIQTLRGHKDNVNCIHVDSTRIISVSYDHRVRVWDFNSI